MGPETKALILKETEKESPPPPEAPPPPEETLKPLGRQGSIYSLTLDEFQTTICGENGKTFGSMNMDEFLTNIWTAEEQQAAVEEEEGITSDPKESGENNNGIKSPGLGMGNQGTCLHRQGSLTLPAPLCRKTVEEVWSEIHKGQQNHRQQQPQGGAARQPTFGEMTLEDFLVKAGVVQEPLGPSSSNHQAPPPLAVVQPLAQGYGMYPSSNTVDPNFGMGPVMSLGFSDHRANGGVSPYPAYTQTGGMVGETSSYAGNGKKNGGYAPGMCFNGRMGNGGGYTASAAIGTNGSPGSPVSSDGMSANPVDSNSVIQYGMDMGGGGARGRKRIIDGPVEKVVERRQRRMIKNRESAARSRARKQAYTVELEAELNQLKEENARLKQAVSEIVKKRRQELLEEFKERPPSKAQRTAGKLKMIRRTTSY